MCITSKIWWKFFILKPLCLIANLGSNNTWDIIILSSLKSSWSLTTTSQEASTLTLCLSRQSLQHWRGTRKGLHDGRPHLSLDHRWRRLGGSCPDVEPNLSPGTWRRRCRLQVNLFYQLTRRGKPPNSMCHVCGNCVFKLNSMKIQSIQRYMLKDNEMILILLCFFFT